MIHNLPPSPSTLLNFDKILGIYVFSLLGRNDVCEDQLVFNIIAAGVVSCKHQKLTG